MAWDDKPFRFARNIAATDKSPLRVIAGPGTGKSFAMKRRIARLLEGGQDPRRALAVTFTRNAAASLVNDLATLDVPGSGPIFVPERSMRFVLPFLASRMSSSTWAASLVRLSLLLNRACCNSKAALCWMTSSSLVHLAQREIAQSAYVHLKRRGHACSQMPLVGHRMKSTRPSKLLCSIGYASMAPFLLAGLFPRRSGSYGTIPAARPARRSIMSLSMNTET